MALFRVRTVNQAELADADASRTQAASNRKRLKRFFSQFEVDGELLILVIDSRPQTALRDYARRWGIETLFAALKTRGFNLEATHFRDSHKLGKLVALLAIAFTWAMRAGLWLHHKKPLKCKAHGRREKSLFRYGLDFLRRLCMDFALHRAEFRQALKLLSPY